MGLVRGAAIKLEIAGGGGHVGAGLFQRFAGVARLQPGERLGFGGDGEAELAQQPSAFGGVQLRPGAALDRPPRRRHRGVDLGRAAGGDLGEGRADGRIDHRDRLRGPDPGVVDQAGGGLGPVEHGGRPPDGFFRDPIAARQIIVEGMDIAVGAGGESVSLTRNEHTNVYRRQDPWLDAGYRRFT